MTYKDRQKDKNNEIENEVKMEADKEISDLNEQDGSMGRISEADLVKGVKLMRELINFMNLDVVITTGGDDSDRTIFISGPDSGLLVGKKGQTLDALHFIFNRMARHRLGISGFINIDVDGYRSKREEALKKMAIELANKARREKKVIPIKPMSARDRRIIHKTLANMKDIKTESEGEGDKRHVQIIPLNVRK